MWRFKYRFAGKQGTVSAGRYPSIGLAEPRAQRDEYRALLAQGIDPSEARRAERARERDDSARQRYEMRFAIESDGALAIRLGKSISPKATQFTLVLSRPHSFASTSVMPITPAFAAA